jgi:histidinol-phosphate aminotransferase
VLKAVREATDGRLRLYPNPTSQALREALAKHHRCEVDQVFVGNGSDEILALAVRAFVEPDDATRAGDPRAIVQYFSPSYSLYPVLADAHGAAKRAVPLLDDFSLPSPRALKARGWHRDAALTLVTTPNAPSGRAYATADLRRLCRSQQGIVLLDETYVDFAEADAMALALECPNVLVSRTFSKAYSLCFMRVGYVVGHHELIAALDKIRDSYNVNGLAQAAGLATLRALPYYRSNFRRIVRTRERLARALSGLGFDVLPSQTNFILVRPPVFEAGAWLERWRERKLLVRWFSTPDMRGYLRISIGTDGEADALVAAARDILRGAR